jgi:hypothetical protein
MPHVLARVQALASHAAAVRPLDADVVGAGVHAPGISGPALGHRASPSPASHPLPGRPEPGDAGRVLDPEPAADPAAPAAVGASPAPSLPLGASARADDRTPGSAVPLTYPPAPAAPSSCRTCVFSL